MVSTTVMPNFGFRQQGSAVAGDAGPQLEEDQLPGGIHSGRQGRRRSDSRRARQGETDGDGRRRFLREDDVLHLPQRQHVRDSNRHQHRTRPWPTPRPTCRRDSAGHWKIFWPRPQERWPSCSRLRSTSRLKSGRSHSQAEGSLSTQARAGENRSTEEVRRGIDEEDRTENADCRLAGGLGGLFLAGCRRRPKVEMRQGDVAEAAVATVCGAGRPRPVLPLLFRRPVGKYLLAGVPSMRHISTIPVFSPYPGTGYGFDKESKAMLDGYLWGDAHHVALSQTNGDYDGRWLFVNEMPTIAWRVSTCATSRPSRS